MDAGTYVATRQYASGGYLQSITYPDNDTIGPMGYAAAGHLYSIPGIVSSIQYDAAGRPTVQRQRQRQRMSLGRARKDHLRHNLRHEPGTSPSLGNGCESSRVVPSASSPSCQRPSCP